MPDRFDKFTDRARRSLTLAQEESMRHNHNYLGTEHLLLALTQDSTSTAFQVLLAGDIDPGSVRQRIEQVIQRGGRPTSGDIGLTPAAKNVISLNSIREGVGRVVADRVPSAQAPDLERQQAISALNAVLLALNDLDGSTLEGDLAADVMATQIQFALSQLESTSTMPAGSRTAFVSAQLSGTMRMLAVAEGAFLRHQRDDLASTMRAAVAALNAAL